MNGHYNNTLKNLLATNNGAADLDWMVRNKIDTQGWDSCTFYDNGTLLGKSNFPTFVLNAYNKKIKCGIPWSSDSEVNQAINYNKAQTDTRKKLTHLVSELEDYGSGNVTPTQFKALLENNYLKASAAGLKFGVYNGWTKQWDVVVKNSDFLLLHCYISSTNMASGKAIYDYIQGRLSLIATEAKKIGKIYPVSIIFSSEASFGGTYFKTNPWLKPYQLLMPEYDKRATAAMRSNIIMDGAYFFVSKTSKVSKP